MLKRVKIQGYKSLADVEVHLQPLSVLFGPNASGKSNFLDALQLLSRIATSRTLREAFDPPHRGTPLEAFTFGPDGIPGLLNRESLSFIIEVDVELSQAVVDKVNRQIQAAKKIKTVAEESKNDAVSKESFIREKFLNYRIEIGFSPKSGTLYVANEALTVSSVGGQPLHGTQSSGPSDSSFLSIPSYLARYPYLEAISQELASWLFFYLEPREHMRASSFVKEVRHIGMMGEELDAFLNTLRVLDKPQFRAVEKALHMIIPSVTGIGVRINNSGKVELSLLQGQTPIPSDLLSDGTLRILGLLALGSAKEYSALIALEEPENGIDPTRLDLIALLLETLASNDSQVIVTTHSPTLLDFVPHESLYAFRQVNGTTVIDPFSSWRKLQKKKVSDAEEETREVSELILRGDFYA